MQQRQLRLGDILDDYCPRERRLTNHAVVAMIGPDVKQTRCTTCDAEHEYKHARVPRQRRKNDQPPALFAPLAAGAPKRVSHVDERDPANVDAIEHRAEAPVHASAARDAASGTDLRDLQDDDMFDDGGADADADVVSDADEQEGTGAATGVGGVEDGPIHRRLIRATLPREGQPATVRPAPDFTIRQPTGRPNRFRRPRGGQPPQHAFGGRNGNVAGGPTRGGGQNRPGGGPNHRSARRPGPGKRSK